LTPRLASQVARTLAEAERAGREDVARYRRDPGLLPELELGAFDERAPGEAARLRGLLRLPIPPRALATGKRLRADRLPFLRAYAFWYGVRAALRDGDLWRRLTRGTTILMYHAFGSADEPATRFVLPAAAFDRQLSWMRRSPRSVIDLGELAACRREHRLPPAGAVAITIDDGYADVQTVAPILHRHGFPATVFLVTGKAGGGNDWDRDGELAGRPLLSWAAVEKLVRDGLSVGAHTRAHPQLPRLPQDEAWKEIDGSRADLEARFGSPPDAFSYPHGRVDDATAALAREAGFALACGIEPGRNGAATPAHRLRRVEVDGRFSLARFVRALALAR
jgi:peptidoglycan/xylan/chitin deacetylase (PgdA/CDA1 family)